jgi:hypothetical protein
MPDCVGIRLSVKCTECETHVPVNGPMERLTCARCGHVITLQGKLRWREILNFHNPSITVFQFAARAKDAADETGAWAPVGLTATRRFPRCACGFKFSEDATRAAAAAERDLACTKCSKVLSVSRVPPFFAKEFPFAGHIIAPPRHADSANANAAVRAGSAGASAIHCSSCGAGLPLGGSRVVTCMYCKTSNAVAEGVWAQLHPATKETWWVLFDSALLVLR